MIFNKLQLFCSSLSNLQKKKKNYMYIQFYLTNDFEIDQQKLSLVKSVLNSILVKLLQTGILMIGVTMEINLQKKTANDLELEISNNF